MDTFPAFFDRWLKRLGQDFALYILPGLAALILLDLNFGLFRGEFSLEDVANFNTMILYYVDKLDLTGQQQMLYAIVTFFVVYFLGYFLHSSSKYFVGPRRFRLFLSVKEAEDELRLPLPAAAMSWLGGPAAGLPDNAGTETCRAIVDASGLPSHLQTLETRCGMYRNLGYLFSLMVLVDIGLFLVAFDFSDMLIKACTVILNLVMAFLFFKGQEESGKAWKELLIAETLVALQRLKKNG